MGSKKIQYSNLDLNFWLEWCQRIIVRWRPFTLALRKVKIHGNGIKWSAM
jgi:hypothetical protein